MAINNAWKLRNDWDYLVFPEDFPEDRRPTALSEGQRLITSDDFVAANNRFGGIVYTGGTMAFTAAYWALAALKPSLMVFLGCDMVYPRTGHTHFYGTGTADPLRPDPTLQDLEAKSARLMFVAARQGCACARMSDGESRLVFQTVSLETLQTQSDLPVAVTTPDVQRAEAYEARLGYFVESGRYWEDANALSPEKLKTADGLWLDAYRASR